MNDPGLDDQIGSDATALEKKHFDEEEEAEEEEQAFLAPRYETTPEAESHIFSGVVTNI
jgi:hypothetical protein